MLIKAASSDERSLAVVRSEGTLTCYLHVMFCMI